MIDVEKNAILEIDNDIGKLASNLRWIRDKLDAPSINARAIIDKIDATLDMLNGIRKKITV